MSTSKGHRSRSSEDERGSTGVPWHRVEGQPGVRGRVLDQAGAPVPGALVAVSSTTSDTHDIAAVADSQGEFDLPPLAPGLYEVQAHSPQGKGRQTYRSGTESPTEVKIVIEPSQD